MLRLRSADCNAGYVNITGFWGAYHAIQALAKQRCYFHLFTELIKVDKLNASTTWKPFRKNFLACSRMQCV